jgi:serine/threonine protein kinase
MGVATGTLAAGFQFGAYVIHGCIGQGGMARIYRAEHRALRKQFALKVMESALLQRPDGQHRFLREGQAAAAVKHPNVVDITDVGVWQGRPYLVMELLEGEDLEQYLTRKKPLAETDVARLMIPVIAGLATAHASGIIHRDLKPSNIFLARGADAEIVPKLLDFGISKLTSALDNLDPSSTPLGELMGSPMYMSPEAVRGARDLTPQSDQYSLGVILYECLTGRAPFYGDSLLGVLEAVAHGKFESPRKYRPDLSASLEAAVLRAMSRDPQQRFANVKELGRALCEAADHRTRLLWTPSFGLRESSLGRRTATLGPSPLMTGSPLSRSLSSGGRRRQEVKGVWAALGVAVVLAVGGFTYWWQARGPYAEKPMSGPPRLETASLPQLAGHLERPGPPRAPAHDVAVDTPGAEKAGPARVSATPASGEPARVTLQPVAPARPPPSLPVAPRAPARGRDVAASRPLSKVPSLAASAAPEAASSPEEVGARGDLGQLDLPSRQPTAAPREVLPRQAPVRKKPVLGANQSPILD